MRRHVVLLRARWAAVPRWARLVLAIDMIGFGQATGQHVNRMAFYGGIHAYAGFRYVPVQAFLVALVVLDPLVVLLAGLVRREVAYLAVAVMACDIPANWSASWPSPPSWAFFVDGAFVFATAVPLLRVMPRGRERPEEAHALPC